MEEDAYGIPKPKDTPAFEPTLLLVPCVGYGPQGVRLGYGGGFYDRTLATLQPRPFTVGLAYAHGFVPWLQAEPHDVPLDAMLTDEGVAWQAPELNGADRPARAAGQARAGGRSPATARSGSACRSGCPARRRRSAARTGRVTTSMPKARTDAASSMKPSIFSATQRGISMPSRAANCAMRA